MDIDILKIQAMPGKCSCSENINKATLNGIKGKEKFNDLDQGEYVLIRIESLSDRMAVEEFIEKFKSK